jgi:hypothetical protein
MDINTKKIMRTIKIIIRTVLLIIVGIIVIILLLYFFNLSLLGLKEDKKLDNSKYIHYFNPNYNNYLILKTSYTSILGGYFYNYNYKENQVRIMEFKQYSKIKIKEINIKNYILRGKNEKPFNFNNGINSKEIPSLFVSLNTTFNKAKQMDIYLENSIEKDIRNENFVYLKFKGISFSISRTDKYPELFFSTGVNVNYEFLVLKKQDKLLFILKYSAVDNKIDDVSLLDMINVN